MTRIQVINSAELDYIDGYKICLQWVAYCYDNGSMEYGYRSIWRDPMGRLQAHRGQARWPSLAMLMKAINQAIQEGWGEYDGDIITSATTPIARPTVASGATLQA